MSATISDRRARFRALHAEGCFVLPNPWDVGNAQMLAQMGFKALASTSSGAAAPIGKRDGELSLEEVLGHLRMMTASTDLPLNGDFEAGFADEPEGMARNVALAVQTGVAGLSIEDRTGGDLHELSLAVERIRAARHALDASREDVMLVGRTEGYLVGGRGLRATIERLVAMAAAGADCLYAPGVTDLAEIRAIVEAVAPKPVNVLLMGPDMHVADLARAWVRRVSTGGTLARTAMAAAESEARGLLAEEAAVSAHPRVEEAEPRKRVPLRPDACLLVIDVQQGFDDPRWGPRNNPQAEDNIGVLLEDWRFMGMPIVHIHHDSTSPDSAFRPGSPGNAPKPVAIPRENETLYRKAVNSAFIGTDLETDLRAKGVGTLVVVGLTTNHCVSTTARMAGNLGFKTYVVADATATFARADLQGRMRSAAEVHAAALGDLEGEFATVVETAAVSQAVTNIFMARRLSCELP